MRVLGRKYLADDLFLNGVTNRGKVREELIPASKTLKGKLLVDGVLVTVCISIAPWKLIEKTSAFLKVFLPLNPRFSSRPKSPPVFFISELDVNEKRLLRITKI